MAMNDLDVTASHISRWENYGVTLPKNLKNALARRDAMPMQDQSVAPLPNVDKLQAKDVAGAYEDYRSEFIKAAADETARVQFRHALNQAVVREARAAVPDIVDQFRPRFDEAATKYAQAVQALPVDGRAGLTDQALRRGGASAMERYEQAREAAQVLDEAWNFLSTTETQLGVRPDVTLPSGGAPVLRIVAVPDQMALRKLQGRRKDATPAEKEINPTAFHATQLGYALQLNSAQDVNRIVGDWPSEQEATKKQQSGFMRGAFFAD